MALSQLLTQAHNPTCTAVRIVTFLQNISTQNQIMQENYSPPLPSFTKSRHFRIWTGPNSFESSPSTYMQCMTGILECGTNRMQPGNKLFSLELAFTPLQKHISCFLQSDLWLIYLWSTKLQSLFQKPQGDWLRSASFHCGFRQGTGEETVSSVFRAWTFRSSFTDWKKNWAIFTLCCQLKLSTAMFTQSYVGRGESVSM